MALRKSSRTWPLNEKKGPGNRCRQGPGENLVACAAPPAGADSAALLSRLHGERVSRESRQMLRRESARRAPRCGCSSVGGKPAQLCAGRAASHRPEPRRRSTEIACRVRRSARAAARPKLPDRRTETLTDYAVEQLAAPLDTTEAICALRSRARRALRPPADPLCATFPGYRILKSSITTDLEHMIKNSTLTNSKINLAAESKPLRRRAVSWSGSIQ